MRVFTYCASVLKEQAVAGVELVINGEATPPPGQTPTFGLQNSLLITQFDASSRTHRKLGVRGSANSRPCAHQIRRQISVMHAYPFAQPDDFPFVPPLDLQDTVRVNIIGHARIRYVGKYQSCMV